MCPLALRRQTQYLSSTSLWEHTAHIQSLFLHLRKFLTKSSQGIFNKTSLDSWKYLNYKEERKMKKLVLDLYKMQSWIKGKMICIKASSGAWIFTENVIMELLIYGTLKFLSFDFDITTKLENVSTLECSTLKYEKLEYAYF